MKNLFAIATALLMVAGLSASPASAKHRKHQMHHQMSPSQSGTVGMAPGGGNAALQGNNGNSAQGSNSLGHIKGGDIGAGK